MNEAGCQDDASAKSLEHEEDGAASCCIWADFACAMHVFSCQQEALTNVLLSIAAGRVSAALWLQTG